MADISSEAPRAGAIPVPGARRTALADGGRGRKPRTLWSDAWRQFRKHKLALTGTCILGFIILAVTFGPLLYRRDPAALDYANAMAPPSLAHPMGFSDIGHDQLARVLSGGRKSLLVGLMAVVVSMTVGTLIGALAGFFGRTTDSLLMRLTDLFIALPQLPLLLLISYLYGDKLKKTQVFGRPLDENGTLILIVIVIGMFNWMPVARLVRASFLSLKEKEFVEAARCLGAGTPSLIFKHILPNVLSPVIVAATLGVGAAIITESSLSFLGLGFPPDVPTWGSMLSVGKEQIEFAPHIAIFPGLMIFLVVLSINYIGDGLRDALDPRARL
jgi:peptide/nickel transport system permease protein